MPFVTACSAPDDSPHNPTHNSRPLHPSRHPHSGCFSAKQLLFAPPGCRGSCCDGIQRAKHRPSSVDVIHPPAAEPAAILSPGHAGDIRRRATTARLPAGSLAKLGQHGKTARRDIRRRRIEQGAMIGEREYNSNTHYHCRHRRRPSRHWRFAVLRSIRARARSHPCSIRPCGIGFAARGAVHRHRDDSGIVDVGIIGVGILKCPAARPHMRLLARPNRPRHS